MAPRIRTLPVRAVQRLLSQFWREVTGGNAEITGEDTNLRDRGKTGLTTNGHEKDEVIEPDPSIRGQLDFGAREATIFSKHGSLRTGSQKGESLKSP